MTVGSNSKATPIDVELLPPEKSNKRSQSTYKGGTEALPRLIALLMDDLFRVPGTKLRFGLNPVLDLFPGVGDGAAALISALTLFVAARYRMPRVVLIRMGLNILLNAVIGLIPGVGEAFAFWFRPSLRNYKMLKMHIASNGGSEATSTRSHWFFVTTIVCTVLLIFFLCVGAGAYLFFWFFHALLSK